MQIRKNITKILFLSIFALSMVFTPSSVKASSNYKAGDLLKIKGVKGAAVYQIGVDGKKYIYPDQKTFNTWYDDFSKVAEVDLSDLDNIADGGTVTFQAGTRLITHRNTVKVYAVGEDGELTYIPDEATARNFYGDTWHKLVLDIDPGLFAVSYKIKNGILSADNLPEGSVVEEEETGQYFLIENGQRRKIVAEVLRLQNLIRKNIIKLHRLSSLYDNGELVESDDDMEDFEIGRGHDKVVVCHKPELANRTIKVSRSALEAHLAHGDVRGRCSGDDSDDDEDEDEDDDDDTTTSTIDIMLSDIALGTNTPTVNATTTITAYIKNSGNTSLTNYQPIFDVSKSLEDFNITSVSTSTVSATDPLVANESASIVWTGYFTATSTKALSVTTDYVNTLAESNETNNTRTENFTVIAEEVVLPDITVSDIVLNLASPTVNATTTITVYIKNSGTLALTNTAGILNGLASFEDFTTTATTTPPIVSVAEPFDPNELLSFMWTGYFTATSTKELSMTADASNQLIESNETNNTRIENVTVLAEVI
ncbi:MAG: CARDB domain-containing protein [Patescibacteria group bacterium]|jgi:hypothetical protein